MNAIERLEKWNNRHKNRSVSISIDDGYGATCWTVTLQGGRNPPLDWWPPPKEGEDRKLVERCVYAQEVAFMHGTFPPNSLCVHDGESDEDWPGLEKTIHAAIDRAEALDL